MKKILIGSTALAAMIALAAPASADEKIKLELGGFFVGAVAVTDGTAIDWRNLPPTMDERSHKFGSNSEIHFKGSMILDTGLRIGFKAELELEDDQGFGAFCFEEFEGGPVAISCPDPVDEVYMFVEGGFGRFEFGQQDGVADQFSVTSPRALASHSANDRRNRDMMDPIGLAQVSTVNDSSGDYAKINYMTPKLGPVKLGVSYTPDASSNSSGYTAALEDAYDQIWEVGLAVDETYNDVHVQLGATYVSAEDFMGYDSKEWNVGVNVGFGGFTVGGSYRDSQGLALKWLEDSNYEAWDAGVAWESGPWKVSGQYGQHEGEFMFDPSLIDGSTYLVAARYKVTKGFRVGAGFQYDDSKELFDDDGSAFIVETALKF